ncbi:hypothetical protein EV356DRAFT_269544 [Viridothelium virens]|uniref:Uncharacterized protein n=1 Tax=Viridothelium virens TaxID=1048519 RepID=A0A6A6HLL7_VIRVR|nr:hypothetical protein EV356DRAFT_269544 [Viridothelium virens]
MTLRFLFAFIQPPPSYASPLLFAGLEVPSDESKAEFASSTTIHRSILRPLSKLHRMDTQRLLHQHLFCSVKISELPQ